MTPQARKVLKHLEKHKHITPLEAIGVYGIYRLAARICELRQSGHRVLTHMQKDANYKPYARYVLN
jgi:hypothetical protein